jgi:hypothetical protein
MVETPKNEDQSIEDGMTSKSSYMVRKRDLLGKTNESIYISLNQ